MVSEKKLINAFSQIKSDMSLLNGELAVAHERIAKLESILIRESVKGTLDLISAKTEKSKKAKKSSNKTKQQKTKINKKKPITKTEEISWGEHLENTKNLYPKLTLKESMQIASRTWKKKKADKKRK